MIFPRCFRVALGLLAVASPAFAQGPIVPSGTPGPTMKTLDQIEPRTPIPGGTLTASYVISASGSYYLTGNLTVAAGTNAAFDGISIQADQVTLDLNGFTIVCTGTGSPSGSAVNVSGARTNVTIRNGNVQSLTNNSGSSVSVYGFPNAGFANGVLASSTSRNVLVENVSVQGPQRGIMIYETDSLSGNQFGSGSVVNCRVTLVNGTGITAALVRGCTASLCGSTAIAGITVCDSYGASAGGTGITGNNVSQSQGESLANATASYGLQAISALNCYGNHTGTGGGLDAQTATNCRGFALSSTGLSAITATTSFGNSSSGTGLSITIANNCYGVTATGTGLSATIAVACGANATGTGGKPFAITNRYNMPATP